ncbi:zeta toxin family protein [Streptomyces sp. PA5.6]|uniref:zeta toxin family protein n=1 Tax=Streptomyces sp. PA5.6 TaxID=3035651 RepID=UPI0039047A04
MIVPQLTADAVTQEQPVVVFVAGQAGSGRTRLVAACTASGAALSWHRGAAPRAG